MLNVDTQIRIVAGSLNVHESMIYRLHQGYDAIGSTTDHPISDRPRVSDRRYGRHIVRQHDRDR